MVGRGAQIRRGQSLPKLLAAPDARVTYTGCYRDACGPFALAVVGAAPLWRAWTTAVSATMSPGSGCRSVALGEQAPSRVVAVRAIKQMPSSLAFGVKSPAMRRTSRFAVQARQRKEINVCAKCSQSV